MPSRRIGVESYPCPSCGSDIERLGPRSEGGILGASEDRPRSVQQCQRCGHLLAWDEAKPGWALPDAQGLEDFGPRN